MMSRSVSILLSGIALGLLGLGVAFVFLPEEAAAALTGRGAPLAFSLLGGALFGLGMMTWMTRHAPIGGIYGRPVLVANLGHFVVGGLALVRLGLDGEATGWTWALCMFYLVGAVFFGGLLLARRVETARAPS